MKKTAFLLALLAAAGVCISSCGESAPSGTPGGENPDAGDTAAVETEPAETRTPHAVPVDTLDFGGDEFRMLAVDWGPFHYYYKADETNGDIMNDALYARKLAVEEALNVKIRADYCDGYIAEIVQAIQKFVSAGEDAYDQVFVHCIQGVAQLASGGYLYDLDALPYVDTDAEWWNRKQMDALKLGKCSYYAVNDSMIPCPYVLYFNKDMVRDLDLDDPYTLVYEKKWTLDVFSEMVTEVTADLNGDGVLDDADRYGIAANDDSCYISFVPAAGQFITGRDADGKIVPAVNTPKMQVLMETFAGLAEKKAIHVQQNGAGSEGHLTMNSNQLLFFASDLTNAESMREYTVDFGFLPYPMFDEAQEDYISLEWGGLTAVPTTISRPEIVGSVMELMAYTSADDVLPTYYDTVLQGKLARDENSVKMIDLLFDTVAYEIGGNYFGFDGGFNALFYALPNVAIKTKQSNFASLYKSNEKATEAVIKKFYKSLELNEAD